MAVAHQPDDWRDFSRALLMPFQLGSLLFVAISSLVIGFFASAGVLGLVMGILWLVLLVMQLTHYALATIEDAANGEAEAQAVSIEMAHAFHDARAWVHPVLMLGAGVLLMTHPEWPKLPVWIGVAVLFPASLGACAMSGRWEDALNPFAMARVMHGLGIWYLPIVAFVLACIGAGVVLLDQLPWMLLSLAVCQLLLLLVYAGIGGALYMRRYQLGFEPRRSPERIARQEEAARHAVRQTFFDELYKDLRVRESARATGKAANWLRESGSAHLRDDVHALLEAGKSWNEPREFPRMLRGLLPVLAELRQPTLALNAAEAGLAAAPAEFCPEAEALTVSLAEHAIQTGRRRTAARLVENHLRRAGAEQSAALLSLRQRLQ